MKTHFRLGLLVLGFLTASPLWGKEAGKGEVKAAASGSKDVGKKKSEEKKLEKEAPPLPPSALSLALKGKLWVGASHGKASLSYKGSSWGVGGGSDLFLRYAPGISLGGFDLHTTVRYLPLAVAAEFGGDSQYVGAMQNYLAGAELQKSLPNNLKVSCGGALGISMINFQGLTGLINPTKPETTGGVIVHAGGGLDWEIQPGFGIGPKIYMGFGSFSMWQASVAGTFAF